VYQWLDRQLLARCDAVICVSAEARTWLTRAGVPNARLRLVQNGHRPSTLIARAEARGRLGVSADSFTAGWVGRLSHEKGADLLVEAVTGHVRAPMHVVLIGDGPERPHLEHALRDRPPGPATIRFAGAVANAATLFAAFDALVISSRTEGLPMVLLEAMSAGVPVVAYAVGGIPEVVSPDSAWLVPPGDTRALATALHEVAAHPAEARRRAAVAQQIFRDRFNETRWVADVEAVYDWVIRHQL
jgi:glycosyltransferase involved in cell wall biosynthesis